MLALIEVGSLFLHFPLAGLLHWGLLFLAVAEVRPCLVYCFVNCGQTCSRFNRYPLFNFMQAQYYFAPFKSTFLAIMAGLFNAGRTGRTSWKVAPRLWQYSVGWSEKPFILDSQMGLRFNLGSDQAAMLHLFIWLNNNFFPSQRYVFSVIVTFGNYSYSCQVGWSHFLCFTGIYLWSLCLWYLTSLAFAPQTLSIRYCEGACFILSRWKEECSSNILISPVLTYEWYACFCQWQAIHVLLKTLFFRAFLIIEFQWYQAT